MVFKCEQHARVATDAAPAMTSAWTHSATTWSASGFYRHLRRKCWALGYIRAKREIAPHWGVSMDLPKVVHARPNCSRGPSSGLNAHGAAPVVRFALEVTHEDTCSRGWL